MDYEEDGIRLGEEEEGEWCVGLGGFSGDGGHVPGAEEARLDGGHADEAGVGCFEGVGGGEGEEGADGAVDAVGADEEVGCEGGVV